MVDNRKKKKKKTIFKRIWRWLQKDVGPIAAPPLGAALIRAISLTAKKEVIGLGALLDAVEENRPIIVAFWHGRLLMLPVFYERYLPWETHVLIGWHTDGEIISRLIERFGLLSVRGSSKRGGRSAGKQMVRLIKGGGVIGVVTPDGPTGPGEVAKRGVIELAYLCRALIFPLSYAASRQVKLGTWDKFIIPMPFSRLTFALGTPLEVTGNEDRQKRKKLLKEVERRLIQANRLAEEAAGRPGS